MRRSLLPILCGLLVAAVLSLFPASASLAGGDDLTEATAARLMQGKRGAFKICPDTKGASDTFALCATATCWMLDNVAYCKCDVMHEKSISLPFRYRDSGKKEDVCDILQDGVGNGFTVSTYATPRQLETDYDPAAEKLGPPLALYTCAGTSRSSKAYSAQCDGGICFESTRGKTFPGFGQLGQNEIICSCPPVLSPPTGFQIAGPWNCKPGAANPGERCCDRGFQARMCGVTKISKTGTEIAVGAPTGVAATLSKLLDGSVPSLNRCDF